MFLTPSMKPCMCHPFPTIIHSSEVVINNFPQELFLYKLDTSALVPFSKPGTIISCNHVGIPSTVTKEYPVLVDLPAFDPV